MITIEERARKAYPENHLCDYECREGFRKAYEEYESLPKIRGWMARDEDGSLMLSKNPPIRETDFWAPDPESWEAFNLPKEMFPEIIWESEPVEVELLIRKV